MQKYGKLRFDAGATRGCINLLNGESVIKFSFNDLRERMKEDLCKKETEIYQEAIKHNLADLFSWSYFLFDYCYDGESIPIYIFQKCNVFSKEASNAIKLEMQRYIQRKKGKIFTIHGKKYVLKQPSEDGEINKHELMLIYSLTIWGPAKTLCLCNFIQKYNITDLHCRNWGEINGRPVLIDYGGFLMKESPYIFDIIE